MRTGGFVCNQIGKVMIDTRYDGQIRKSMRRLYYGKASAHLWQNGSYQIHALRVSPDGARPSEMRQ